MFILILNLLKSCKNSIRNSIYSLVGFTNVFHFATFVLSFSFFVCVYELESNWKISYPIIPKYVSAYFLKKKKKDFLLNKYSTKKIAGNLTLL